MIFLAKIKIRVLGIHLTSAPLPSNSPLPSLTWLSPTTFGVKFYVSKKIIKKSLMKSKHTVRSLIRYYAVHIIVFYTYKLPKKYYILWIDR